MTPTIGYREVANRLRAAIHDDTYPRGAQLPTEDQLARQLNANRVSVNRALRILGGEGLVYVHRGVGTFVHPIPPITRPAVTRHNRSRREQGGSGGALATELKELGYTLTNDVAIGRTQPPDAVAALLRTDHDEAVFRSRRMSADGWPIQIVTTYIPLEIAAGTLIEERDTGVGGISSRLADLGHPQATISERITVRPPDEEEAKFLRMTADQRVYEILHLGRTAKGDVVKATVYILPTHQWNLEYEYPLNDA